MTRPRTPSLSRRLICAVALATVVALGLSGCSMGGWVYRANLPGGADLGSDPLTIKARFSDVLDLVPQSSVKVDDVAVGRVESISLAADGRSALVTLQVNRSVNLPDGTTARLEQTSLLGEKYVALVPPAAATSAAAGVPLQDGVTLPLGDTSEAADAEEVLGALSLVLNGGGIGQFQQISRELQKLGHGRTGQIRDFLTQLDRFVASLDERKGAITSALDGLDRLSATLKANDGKITTTLDGISPGLKVLAQQRPQLVTMLTSLNRLSHVTVSTLHKSQAQIVADLKELDPVLTKLAQSGADLPDSLQILLTYPFPDSVLGAIQGDYLNVFMTTNFRTVPAGCAEEGCAWPQVGGGSVGPSTRLRGALPAAGSQDEGPPTLLPPTDTPLPGASASSVPAPSILRGSAAGSPGASPSTARSTPIESAPPTRSGSPTPTGPVGSPTADGSASSAGE